MDDYDFSNTPQRKLRHVLSHSGRVVSSRRAYGRNKLAGLQPMELDWRIAALIGAGLTDDRISSELEVDAKLVSRVRRNVPSDPDLARIVERVRAKITEKMVAGAEKALDRMTAALDGFYVSAGKGQIVKVDCQPQQAAAVWRELAKATGLAEPASEEQTGQVSQKIDFTDPRQRVAALKVLQRSALEAEQKRIAPEDREPAALPPHKEAE